MHQTERFALLVTKLVRGMQAGERVAQNTSGQSERKAFFVLMRRRDQTGERLALYVVHHEIQAERVLVDFEHGHDVRVPNARCELGLFEQLQLGLLVFSQVRVQELERHFPLEATDTSSAGEKNRGHASRTEREEQLVPPDTLRKRRGGVLLRGGRHALAS